MAAATSVVSGANPSGDRASFDAFLGGASVITELKRAIRELRGMEAYDGGADGVASTRGDNTLFMTNGLFFP